MSAVLALLASASPLPAATQTLVPIKVATAEFVRCIAGRDSAAAHQLVVEQPTTRVWSEAMARLTHRRDSCVRNYRISMRRNDIRGALGEHLLERDPKLPARLSTLAPKTPIPAAVNPATFGDDLARCVAAAEPAGALAVLKTDIAAAEERAAVMALKPAVDRCLPVTGRQQLTVSDLRNHLAVALYQMAAATGTAD